jgi:hypothetical protein
MVRLGVLCVAATLAFAPQAAATGKLKAKFKVLSASGRLTQTFHEEGSHINSEGQTVRCVGTTTAEATWRTTKPMTAYVFVRRGKNIEISGDRVGQILDFAPFTGTATVSRLLDYQETAGCHKELTACPKATGPARMYLAGNQGRRKSIVASIDRVRLPESFDLSCKVGGLPGFTDPFGSEAGPLLPRFKVYAAAVLRSRLLNRHRKRLKDSVTVKQPFSEASTDPDFPATLSGIYTDHTEISLKRLKLKR